MSCCSTTGAKPSAPHLRSLRQVHDQHAPALKNDYQPEKLEVGELLIDLRRLTLPASHEGNHAHPFGVNPLAVIHGDDRSRGRRSCLNDRPS